MMRAAIAAVATALVVALAGACLLALGIDWGHDGIACSCRSGAFFANVAFYGSVLGGASAVYAVAAVRACESRLVRWFVIAGSSLLPYVVLAEKFRDVTLLALVPCCVVASLVEGWTRDEPRVPVATLMRS